MGAGQRGLADRTDGCDHRIVTSGSLPVPGAQAILPGLWRWTAWHPEWEQDVGCVAIWRGDALVLVDPMVPDDAWEALDGAVGRMDSVAIVLTVFFHERSACAALDRWPGVELWAERGGLDEIACEVSRPFAMGDPLPGGLESLATPRPGEVVLWDPETRTLVSGDVLLGDDDGGLVMCPEGWLPEGVGHAELARLLRPILALPIDRVLVSHGEPVLRDAGAALARALESPR